MSLAADNAFTIEKKLSRVNVSHTLPSLNNANYLFCGVCAFDWNPEKSHARLATTLLKTAAF